MARPSRSQWTEAHILAIFFTCEKLLYAGGGCIPSVSAPAPSHNPHCNTSDLAHMGFFPHYQSRFICVNSVTAVNQFDYIRAHIPVRYTVCARQWRQFVVLNLGSLAYVRRLQKSVYSCSVLDDAYCKEHHACLSADCRHILKTTRPHFTVAMSSSGSGGVVAVRSVGAYSSGFLDDFMIFHNGPMHASRYYYSVVFC